MSICDDLFAMQDPDYKAFHQKLIPTVNPDRIIGVRTPALRQYAKRLAGTKEAEVFLRKLPHEYYEEDNLHAFILEQQKEEAVFYDQLAAFLPYIDNWATCDMFSPKLFIKNPPPLSLVGMWLKSAHTYTVRFGLGVLMRYYLKERFSEEVFALVLGVRSEEYYINMMLSWFFAEALIWQYEKTVSVLECRCLPSWVQNKAIQKAVESRRLSDAQKSFLRGLKFAGRG